MFKKTPDETTDSHPTTPPSLPVTSNSTRRFKFWLIPVAIITLFLSTCLVGKVIGSLHAKEKIRTVEQLSSLDLTDPNQLAQAKGLCTKKGDALLDGMLKDNGAFMPAAYGTVGIKSNPHLVDVEMVSDQAEGKSRIFVRLIDQGGWKFDDIYVAERNGRSINMQLSKIQQCPWFYQAKYYLPEIKQSARAGRDLVDIIVELKKLDEKQQGKKSEIEGIDVLQAILHSIVK